MEKITNIHTTLSSRKSYSHTFIDYRDREEEMSWIRGRRGMSWKDQTLDSIAPLPMPLMVFCGLLAILVYFAASSDHSDKVERRKSGFRFSLLMLPVLVILVMNMVVLRQRMVQYNLGMMGPPIYKAATAAEAGSPSTGLLLVLIVMVYFHPAVQSAWFRLF